MFLMLWTYFKKLSYSNTGSPVSAIALYNRNKNYWFNSVQMQCDCCVVTTKGLYNIYRRFWKTSYIHSVTQVKTANWICQSRLHKIRVPTPPLEKRVLEKWHYCFLVTLTNSATSGCMWLWGPQVNHTEVRTYYLDHTQASFNMLKQSRHKQMLSLCLTH